MSDTTAPEFVTIDGYNEAEWAAAAQKQQDILAQSLHYAAQKMHELTTSPDAVMSNKRREQLMRDRAQTLFVSTLVLESPAFIPMAESWLAAAERVTA